MPYPTKKLREILSHIVKSSGTKFLFLCRKAKGRFSEFVRKHHAILAIVTLPILSALLAYGFLNLFAATSSIRFFWLLLYYTVFLVLGYIYLSYTKSTDWINAHQAFLAVLGVLIPVILFSWQQVVNESNVFWKHEVSIKEEDNRNSRHLQNIITDLAQDSNTVFWEDFSVDSYRQYWDYIHLNYSQDCKNLYAALTVQLGIINTINKMRRDLILIPTRILPVNLSQKMLETASSTQPILNRIIGNCQRT